MARSNNNLKSVLQDTATAIKTKAGTVGTITPRDFADAINGITSANDILPELDNLDTGNGIIIPDAILANNSWETIRDISESGTATNYWAVGDEKTDTGTDGYTRTFRIVDMSDLYGKHVVFEQVNVDGTDGSGVQGMAWDANSGTNYATSNANVNHLPSILTRYSSELQNTLTNTTVKVATSYNDPTIQNVTAKLFLEAEKEIWASRTYSLQAEFDALTTFSYYTTHTSSSYHIKYDSISSTARTWWLRSPGADSVYVCVVNGSGGASYGNPSSTYRFAPCFSF